MNAVHKHACSSLHERVVVDEYRLFTISYERTVDESNVLLFMSAQLKRAGAPPTSVILQLHEHGDAVTTRQMTSSGAICITYLMLCLKSFWQSKIMN